MEGGYINEGGQLKTKNGQKYIVNDTREGIFVSKSCAFLTAVIAVLAIIIAILVTYFLTALNKTDSCTTNTLNGTVAAAAIYGTGSSASQIITNGNRNVILNDDSDDRHNPEISRCNNSLIGMKNNDAANTDNDGIIQIDEELISKEIKFYEGWNPEIYRLTIEPNLKTSSNNGTVIIEMKRDLSVEKLQPIVFDIYNITIHNVEVKILENNFHQDIEYEYGYGSHNETFHITILSDIRKYDDAIFKVKLNFTSQITDTMQGIYKSPYRENGEDKFVISTQFSPTDARRAFPCFDRPDKKANFSISIVHTETTTALSNMPSNFIDFDRPGYIKEEFAMTPKMSTYLVAFVISDLKKGNYSDTDKKLIPNIEIWSKSNVLEMTKYPYQMTRKILPYFENYFGIPFRLPKLDLISIPDFGYGGMENWGLITFRDSSLLVPEGVEQSSSATHKESVSIIIAHELAHQWLGNLVTPKWWNDLWLKEGFATYLSYLAVDHFEPDWDVLSTFAINEFSVSMAVDSDKYAHPIASNVTSISEIRRKFDSISYSKGAIMLRMINKFIGDEAFKMSIRDYLKKFSYKNAMHDDLWDLMTYYGHQYNTFPSHLNVKNIMDTWTLQSGYPVVTLERSGRDLILSQKRYMLPEKNSSDDSKWDIPINYVTDEIDPSFELPIYWIPKENEKITIPNVFSSLNNTKNFVYLNHNRQGYFRVNYDMLSWIALNDNFEQLPSLVRAQLLEDSFYLARAEFLTYDVPLTFLMRLSGMIDDHQLWTSASRVLDFLSFRLNREPAYETFRALMKFIVKPAFDHYGLNEPDNESHTMLAHRSTVAQFACKYNYDRCMNAAQLKYREWMRDAKRNPIKPNLKGTIYCTALREGSFQEWYFLYNRYKEISVASEKEQIISALGCTTKPWLLSKYLNMTIDENSGIRKQDGPRAFAAVARNNIGYEIAYDFLVTNIKRIVDYYGDGFSTLSSMVQSITIYMDKEYHLEQLDRFANKVHSLGFKSIERTIEFAKEDIKNSIFWRSRSYYSLKGFLESLVNELHINLY